LVLDSYSWGRVFKSSRQGHHFTVTARTAASSGIERGNDEILTSLMPVRLVAGPAPLAHHRLFDLIGQITYPIFNRAQHVHHGPGASLRACRDQGLGCPGNLTPIMRRGFWSPTSSIKSLVNSNIVPFRLAGGGLGFDFRSAKTGRTRLIRSVGTSCWSATVFTSFRIE
jgi:hypothetical protein